MHQPRFAEAEMARIVHPFSEIPAFSMMTRPAIATMTTAAKTSDNKYPPISDYALISDCHCNALISRAGSVDWCCMQRIDDDSCFGRLLDWDRGGHCAVTPADPDYESTRRYIPETMILETHFKTAKGEVRLCDFFAMDTSGAAHQSYDLIRIIDGISGEMELRVEVCPRFDYGEIAPYMTRDAGGAYTAIGSNKGLIIHTDIPFEVMKHMDMAALCRVKAGDRSRLMINSQCPELIAETIASGSPAAADIDALFDSTLHWWKVWSERIRPPFELDERTRRSTLALKSLTFERTGAIAAASTTSLPEWIGGERNWDYRYSWIRDSVFTVRALHDLGYVTEADRFHQFIQRSSAGNADELQIMYGIDGKRRLTEIELDWMEGYKESRPVRIGNRAAKQNQLDIYGELLEMAWEWHESGHPTDPHYWTFLENVVDTACRRWNEQDHGIWEVRGEPQHYVHSKVMCWVAVHCGVMLAEANKFTAPTERWSRTRDEIRHAVETKGYDEERGIFVQTFEDDYLDASLLLMPHVGFIDYKDERMIRTVDAICEDLEVDGLLLRYKSPDGLKGKEGMFLPCTFWLVDCLAHQGRTEMAWEYYDRALACANDLGLFSEEYDVEGKQMLGNFPQGLTHVSQIMARLALSGVE
jgi:GH15 family glucan-1,4-alpha-glucosidase